MGIQPLEIVYFFYTSEYDVYRRQIMTYKNGPRTERVNVIAIQIIKNVYIRRANYI